jgi:hypothetical protein
MGVEGESCAVPWPMSPSAAAQGGGLSSWCPARHQVGPSSVTMLPVAERVECPIVAAPMASPCAHGDRWQVSSSTGELSESDRSVVDMKYGLGLGECALQQPPRDENLSLAWDLTMAAGDIVMRALWDEGRGGAGGKRSSPGVDSGLSVPFSQQGAAAGELVVVQAERTSRLQMGAVLEEA